MDVSTGESTAVESGEVARLFAGTPFGAPQTNASRLLGSPALNSAGGAQVRALALKRAQQTHGNRFAQRAVAGAQKNSTSRLIQRQCSCGTCEQCAGTTSDSALILAAGSEVRSVQAKAANGNALALKPAEPLMPEGSSGIPIGEAALRFMESHFAADFSDVRIHNDLAAGASANALHADAYTIGRDIYFAPGKYEPSTPEGQRLLAHELAHTVQQGAGFFPPEISARSGEGLTIGAPDDPLEYEAEQAADAVARQNPVASEMLSGDSSVRIRRYGLSDLWADTGGRVVGYVGEKVEAAYEAGKEWIVGKIEEYAPGLLELLRGNIIDYLKDRIVGGLDSLLGGLISRVQKDGLLGAIEAMIGEVVDGLTKNGTGLTAEACGALGGALQSILDAARTVGGRAFDAVKQAFSGIGQFLGYVWENLGQPAWKAIKGVAGDVWDWLEAKAKWVWEKTAPVRRLFGDAWSWLKRQFGLLWDSGTDIYDWFKAKAAAAWDKIKSVVEPILGPLKIIAGIALLLSPLGPIVLIWQAGPKLWESLKWLWQNWDKTDLVVRARQILQEHILPTIGAGIVQARALLTEAGAWLAGKAQELATAFGQLADALGVSTLLRAARQGVLFIAEQIGRFANWAKTEFLSFVEIAKHVLQRIWDFLHPILVMLLKLGIVIINPWLWPVFIGAVAWRVLPDCLKPPIVDFVLDLMISTLKAIPDFKSFGESWAQVKQGILQELVAIRGGAVEDKIKVTNRLAEVISGGDLEIFGNMIVAVRQTPEHFEGQVEEELIGTDLTQPLPFERLAANELGDDLTNTLLPAVDPNDRSVLTRAQLGDADVAVDQVARLELDPEFIDSLELEEGKTIEFGSTAGDDRTVRALQRKAAGAPDETSGSTPAWSPDADASAPVPVPTAPEPTIEEQLDLLVASQPLPPCTRQPAPEKTVPTPVPEDQKIGPLTRGQRAHYVFAQMRQAIGHWWSCNRSWLLPTLIASLIVLAVLIIVTEGAALGVLGEILEVVGGIMLGVAAVRSAVYIAGYLAKSITGDIVPAAKSLARALAIAAIELVFIIIFNAGEIIKGFKQGIGGATRAVGRSIAKTATGGIEAAGKLGRRAARAAGAVAEAVVENGRLILRGGRSIIARGVRNLEEFGAMLSQRIRARVFKLFRRGDQLVLEACINPCLLMANGEILKNISIRGRPEIGDIIEGVGRRKAGIVVGVFDTVPSSVVQDLEGLTKGELQQLYRDLAAETSRDAMRARILGEAATGANAKELRKALLAAKELAMAGDHAHHIVPSTHRLASEARRIIAAAGIEINDARNGIFLSAALHDGLHTNAYIVKVTDLLIGAKPQDVPAVLEQIKALIRTGKF
jgi:hypothetical protein